MELHRSNSHCALTAYDLETGTSGQPSSNGPAIQSQRARVARIKRKLAALLESESGRNDSERVCQDAA